jgi:dTDP-4-dehydrorhamnose reductase
MDPRRTIVTGGSGLLGRTLRRLLPEAAYPPRAQFDVTDYAMLELFVRAGDFELVIHAAAFTSPPRVDQHPVQALDANVIGTANVVKLCARHGLRLVYISTDYVFRGDRGRYREEDELHPVNGYAWSKLAGECAVRLYRDSLIIRTTFGPDVFPYPAAFSDQWTSRQPVSVAAEQILTAVKSGATGVLHVGGPRRTVLEYARSLDPSREIKSLSVCDVAFAVPTDTSLVTERYRSLTGQPGAAGPAASED